MLITRETDYALRILRALMDGGRHTMGDLCRTEAIPQQFAYKIIRKLARAGLVQNLRGSGGGCQLRADLQALTLLDLLEAMGETRKITACLEGDTSCTWQAVHAQRCCIHGQLADIQARLDRELRSHSLHSLIVGEE